MHRARGASLLDTIIGVALMTLVFVGISGVFQLSVELVSNNKARTGALALAQEQLEYVRSLPYDSLGTQGGIPSGALVQTEAMSLNGVQYTRRLLIRYIDDPKDGSAGADTNGIIADAKEVKVEVSWVTRGMLRATALITRVSPPGIEQAVPGGTLELNIVNAAGAPVSGALVRVVNASTSVDTQAYSDVNGIVQFIGTPSGTGYQITVTKSGMNAAYTYAASTTNPSPTPGHLTVSNNLTTSVTFAIDTVATLAIRTWEAITEVLWEDVFVDTTNVAVTSTTTVSGGALRLAGVPGSYEPGFAASTYRTPPYLVSWQEAAWADTKPTGTSVTYHIYRAGGSGLELVPDSDLPGNAAGFTTSPISLIGLSTTTYVSLALGAELSTVDPNETPLVSFWALSYAQGPVPLPAFAVSLVGSKTIGTNGGTPVFTYERTHTTNGSGIVTLTELEWDTYTVDGTDPSKDLSAICMSQPTILSPGVTVTTDVYFSPDTAHSLLVDVKDASGAVIPTASVRLHRGAFDETQNVLYCGQSFFLNLSPGTVGGGNQYALDVSAPGFQSVLDLDADVSGDARISVVLNPS